MLKQRVKKMSKDALTLGATGVGLGVMGGVSESAAPAIGVLGSGLGKVGGLVMVGHGMKILDDIVPKKGRRFWKWLTKKEKKARSTTKIRWRKLEEQKRRRGENNANGRRLWQRAKRR